MPKKASQIGEKKKREKYYLGIIRGKGAYKVYFINNSDNHIKSLTMKSPGMATFEDKPVTTSTKEKIIEDIEPRSYAYIEALGGYYQADFVTYYYFTLTTENEEKELSCSIGKRIGFMGTRIPILNKMGRIIYFRRS